VVRHGRCQVERRHDGYPLDHGRRARPREPAIASAIRGQVDDDGSGFHPGHHLALMSLGREHAADEGGGDHDVGLRALVGQ